MRIRRPFFYLFIFVLILAQSAFFREQAFARPNPRRAYAVARTGYSRLIKNKKKQKLRSAWEGCINRFDKISFSSHGTKFGRLASYYGAEARERLYKISRVHSDLVLAGKAYLRCIRDYPKSREAAKARKRLKALGIATGGLADRKSTDSVVYERPQLKGNKHGRVITLSKASHPVNDEILTSSLPAAAHKDVPEAAPGADSTPADTVKKLVRINEIRHWSNIGYTRVVIDMEGEAGYTSGRLKNPDRLFFDLKDAYLPKGHKDVSIDVNDGVLRRIRASQHNADTVRVVLDLASIASSRTLMLQNPTRLIIDVSGKNQPINTACQVISGYKNISSPSPKQESSEPPKPAAVSVPVPAQIAPAPAAAAAAAPATAKPVSRPQSCGIGTIVIDPGHGGKDTGAIGCNGLYEKNVVLDIGLRLRKIIRKNFNCKVVMTRDRDIFIPLDERPGIAVQNDADLFISIHANASRDPSAHGIETYLLNLTKDRHIMQVAERENMTELKSMGPLEAILKDLILDSKRDDSLRLAHCVQSCLISGLRKYDVNNKGVKQGPFLVLYGASMPSILTEVGFITNPEEEARLARPEYRQKIAQAIFDGIKKYLRNPSVTAYQKPR